MALETYAKKRNFKKTSEPPPRVHRSKTPIFVIQKHAASRLHYDFRLEIDGVLVSWAVPKGPSYNPLDKRLAVHVEDHPFDYRNFEGTIPAGEYGGGSVIVWDHGTWQPLDDDPSDALKRGKLVFALQGKKLQGVWSLVRMKRDEKNWLLVKRADETARHEGDIATDEPRSVLTERTVEEVSEANSRPQAKPQSDKKRSAKARHSKDAGTAHAAQLPLIGPELATLVQDVPEGDAWLFEIKFDGYRGIGYADGARSRIVTRNGHNWSDKFAPVVESLASLPCKQAIVDGEIVVLRPDGVSDFQLLQNALDANNQRDLRYYIFDLLHLDGDDLRDMPLVERKARLKQLLAKTPTSGRLLYSDHAQSDGEQMFEQARQHGLEGLIAKRKNSTYVSRRSLDWVKIKCTRRQEFVVAGFTQPGGSRSAFGALLLSYYEDNGDLIYAGRVGTGFNAASLRYLSTLMQPLHRDTAALKLPPRERGITWVEPKLVVEVSFSNWTQDGALRHPSFQGVRDDKSPRDVGRERAIDTKNADKPSATRKKRRTAAQAKPLQRTIAISNADRVVYPDVGLTKGAIADYYAMAAERMLPHIANRPLTLVRCPQGHGSKCFYQRHLHTTLPDLVRDVMVDNDKQPCPYIEVADGLQALVQNGVLEMHTWGCRVGNIEHPDVLIFDLDPAPDVGAQQLVTSAKKIKSVLEELALRSFVKRTGGKGVHVVVPLKPNADWERVKKFGQLFADRMELEEPKRYTANMSKAQRAGKVFIDYFRNGRGSTAVAPYSTRSLPGAPVALPIAWEDLTPRLLQRPTTIAQAIASTKDTDPWLDYFSVKQQIRG